MGLALGLDALLFGTLDLLDGLLWGGQFFGHRAAQIGDGLAHLLADDIVRRVGVVLVIDLLAAYLGLGLCDAEPVCGELLAVHVIEDVLSLCQSFACGNITCLLAVIESSVALILEDGKVALGCDTRKGDGICKTTVLFSDLPSQEQTFLVLRKLRRHLLQTLSAFLC